MDRIEIKSDFAVTEAGLVSGIAWPFGSPDRVGDVIERGAFAKAAAPIPMLAFHDQAETVGVWDEVTEADDGLHVKGRLLIKDVARAKEVRALIQEKALRGLSIGFKSVKAAPRQGGGRTIAELELLEVSVVAVPAHPGARITDAKAQEGATQEVDMTDETKTDAPDTKALDVKLSQAVKKIDARLDAIEAKANRPTATADTKAEPSEERKAFIDYLQRGDAMSADSRQALTTVDDTTNHILAPEDMQSDFIRNLVEFSPTRAIAEVRSTTGGSLILPQRTGITNAKWVGETEARTESEPTFDQAKIEIKELATFVDISLRLAEDSANVLSEVNLALSEDFGQKEALAFVNGTGALEPSGVMTNTDIASMTAASATAINPDELIALLYGLPATYRNAGTWLMNGQTLAALRTLKDGHGNYLWQPSYQVGQPETILGRPVIEAVDMPNVAAGASPIIFGDFKRGYRIYDRLALAVLTDPYTQRAKGMVRYHARRRLGAGVVRPTAFKKLKMKAA